MEGIIEYWHLQGKQPSGYEVVVDGSGIMSCFEVSFEGMDPTLGGSARGRVSDGALDGLRRFIEKRQFLEYKNVYGNESMSADPTTRRLRITLVDESGLKPDIRKHIVVAGPRLPVDLPEDLDGVIGILERERERLTTGR